MQWEKLSHTDKCWVLGGKGEQFASLQLKKTFSPKKYLILNLHALCEMDFAIVNKETEKIVAIYEVKTTTEEETEYRAGSRLQLATFQLQQSKMAEKKPFIPGYLYVIKVNNSFWDTGELIVENEIFYNLTEFTLDFEHTKWIINSNKDEKGT